MIGCSEFLRIPLENVLSDSRTISVGSTTYTADHILIAVGGQPSIPATPGAELGITSDGFFDLTELPK
jgi:glutathione reductase (NADPH)